MYLYL